MNVIIWLKKRIYLLNGKVFLLVLYEVFNEVCFDIIIINIVIIVWIFVMELKLVKKSIIWDGIWLFGSVGVISLKSYIFINL